MDFAAKRARLIELLQSQIKDQRVLAAMRKVPRECFVLNEYESGAYFNEPLPIGHHQTISQPLIVAMMAEALELKGNEKILEVGTGSGYQAAVLAELACDVITTERIPALAESARKALNCLGYTRVKIFPAADKLGWEPEAPYDGIVVTAGAPRVPASLLNQLTVGGKLVIPVGERDIQRLLKITKLDTGNRVQDLGSCRFVPLIGAEAWEA